MPIVILLAPLFVLFELWQLVLGERYLGVKQISRGVDPRALGLGEATAFGWSTMLVLYWIWMLLLLVSMFGFSLRRGCPLKRVLVILTFEGAIRIGLLVSLAAMAWRRFLA